MVAVTLMAIVAALVATWAVKDNGGRSPSSSARQTTTSIRTTPIAPPTRQAGTSPVAPSGAAGGATSPATTSPATTAPVATTTTTTAVPITGTGPVLTALEPASGSPGQSIVVTGSNFLSPSGQITAHFGADTATVACLAPTSCLVIVPPDGAFVAATPVTVTTDTGTSNPLTFNYS